ncbi:uncharacterized protein [Mytilus edulis]|uniref:uncharacterized protein n=1 Tax=Mytilus edulis TaxID=6550 RepID=UPI0039F022B7
MSNILKVSFKDKPSARRQRYRQYSPTTLSNALQKVIANEISAYKASVIYGVPITTLIDRVKGRVDPETMKSGPPPLFSLEQEAHLVNHIKKMSHLGYGYTRVEVTALASDYAVSIRLKDKTDKQLSLQWFRSFMDRWPDLKLQKPRALSISRAKGASKEVIDSYFDELENILNKYDLKNKPHCIYNIDEKGITPEHTPPKVVADVEINASAVTSERDKTTTIIADGNAIGTQIPPFLVFAGQRMRQELIQGCTRGTTGDVSPTG